MVHEGHDDIVAVDSSDDEVEDVGEGQRASAKSTYICNLRTKQANEQRIVTYTDSNKYAKRT